MRGGKESKAIEKKAEAKAEQAKLKAKADKEAAKAEKSKVEAKKKETQAAVKVAAPWCRPSGRWPNTVVCRQSRLCPGSPVGSSHDLPALALARRAHFIDSRSIFAAAVARGRRPRWVLAGQAWPVSTNYCLLLELCVSLIS